MKCEFVTKKGSIINKNEIKEENDVTDNIIVHLLNGITIPIKIIWPSVMSRSVLLRDDNRERQNVVCRYS